MCVSRIYGLGIHERKMNDWASSDLALGLSGQMRARPRPKERGVHGNSAFGVRGMDYVADLIQSEGMFVPVLKELLWHPSVYLSRTFD